MIVSFDSLRYGKEKEKERGERKEKNIDEIIDSWKNLEENEREEEQSSKSLIEDEMLAKALQNDPSLIFSPVKNQRHHHHHHEQRHHPQRRQPPRHPRFGLTVEDEVMFFDSCYICLDE
jgi:hypothetical protein